MRKNPSLISLFLREKVEFAMTEEREKVTEDEGGRNGR